MLKRTKLLMAMLELRATLQEHEPLYVVGDFVVQADVANKMLDMPSRQTGCCLTALAMLHHLHAQSLNNTSPNAISQEQSRSVE